ncbi:MAG: glycoside hydrolase family 11 protein, partial [Muribaculaceae bacterium]|nr:glycoside hydrolase family 11 protein [Muribaculaceae bacterium]
MKTSTKLGKWIEMAKTLAAVIVLMTLTATTAWADFNPCNANTGHPGSGTNVSDNNTGSISGTRWGYEQWYQGGNGTMTYYNNGTFQANWSESSDYRIYVGYQYGNNGPGVDHTTKDYAVDYKYTKTGSAQFGYIGVSGWTKNPQVEYFIIDDWYSKPSEQYIGEKFGEIEVDGAKYTIHAYLRQQEPCPWGGTSTYVQFFSLRETPRQCGHIDISAHFRKWDELFTGQNKQLRGSKGGGNAQLKFGNLLEVMMMAEAGGSATGSIDFTYFNMTDKSIPYATLSTDKKTLTFNYAEHKVSGDSEWDVKDTGTTGHGWSSYASDITKVVFDPSFADARPLSCSAWFEGCSNLTTIDGLENLNTSETINMRRMFYGCSSLTSLSIGIGFTVNVSYEDNSENYQGPITDTTDMFTGCTGLANGTLKVMSTTAPSIAQNIFGVFTNGKLITNLTKEQLGITDASSPYTWKGGQFTSVGKASIKYLDENGVEQTAEALPITSSNTNVSLDGGWYYVENNVTINGQLQFNGDAHLILADGCKMTVGTEANPIDYYAIYGNNANLTIYGQSTGSDMGRLSATGSTTGIKAYSITINGGAVTATATETEGESAKEGIYALSDIIIRGGSVSATARDYGINTDGGKVNILGGQVTAIGNVSGIWGNDESEGNPYNITLGWTNPTDFIKASSYKVSVDKAVKIADGKHFKAVTVSQTGTDPVVTTEKPLAYIAGGHTFTSTELTALKGKKLKANSDGLAYLDWDGTQKKLVSKDTGTDGINANDIVYILDGTETTLGTANAETWYVCNTPATENDGK